MDCAGFYASETELALNVVLSLRFYHRQLYSHKNKNHEQVSVTDTKQADGGWWSKKHHTHCDHKFIQIGLIKIAAPLIIIHYLCLNRTIRIHWSTLIAAHPLFVMTFCHLVPHL